MGFLIGSYALLIEPQRITVKYYRIASQKWTEPPLRIALIAYVHAIWPWMSIPHIKRIVKKTNALDPDLILLLGDYVSTHPFGRQIDPTLGVMPYQNLRASCGVFAVLGNHDLHGHGSDGWPEAMRSSGLSVLENQSVKTTCSEKEFWVSGLEDLWWQNADIPKTLDQVLDNKPVIMAMHNPDSFIDIPKNVTLSVSGHTHRGQIRFPFIGAIEAVIPSKYGKRFHYGHIVEMEKI